MADSTPTSETSSWKSIGIHRDISRNLRKLGYAQPREIQAAVAPALLDGRDVIGLARTGMGKTAAFLAPIATRLLDDGHGRALIVCPTRELAMQVEREAGRLTRQTPLRTAVVYGKVGMQPQVKQLAERPQIVVGTPGRLRELAEADALALASFTMVVIDEADRMLDMGFKPQVSALLRPMDEARQLTLFTATMPRDVEQMARAYLHEPVRIETEPTRTAIPHVACSYVSLLNRDKVEVLLRVLKALGVEGDGEPKKKKGATSRRRGTGGGVLVFCRTKRRASYVAAALRRHDITTGVLHGDRTQAQRIKTLDRFVDGSLQVVIATDVASRGLHIETVKTVVNYDLPGQVEDFVHRIGRAAHGEVGSKKARGEAISFVTPRERDAWQQMAAVLNERAVERDVEGHEPPTDRGERGGGGGRRMTAAEREAWLMEDTGKRPPSRRSKTKRGPYRGRTRASKPIGKDDKPGGGVKRVKKPE